MLRRRKSAKKPQDRPQRNVNPPKEDKGKGKESKHEMDVEEASGSSVIAIQSPQNIWFKLVGLAETPWTKILLENVHDVDDLKKAIKKESPILLKDYDSVQLILKAKKKVESDDQAVELGDPRESIVSVQQRFGHDFEVLVSVPPEEHALKRKHEEGISDILEQLKAIREEKKIIISISRITQKHITMLLEEHGLRSKTIKFNVTPTSKPIQPFIWGDKKEDAYAKGAQGYINWLERNIDLPDDVQFYVASSKANLLSTTLASSQFYIKGTLDMAIVDRINVESGNIAGGMRVGLELKKQVTDSDILQANVELITANICSIFPVVIVLTDLGERWQFFWLQRGLVVDCVFDCKKGVTLLQTIVQQSNPPVIQPTPDAPYMQRCDLRTATSQARESHDALPEDTEVEGLEQVLQRPKIDIMGMLPEDDVADMRDVFDVMTPAEVREWQTRRVLAFAMQTPAVQSKMKEEDWRSMYS